MQAVSGTLHTAVERPFGCEKYKLSKISPGPVRDAELLNLIITDPQAVDQRTGKLLPVLVKPVDVGELSVLRDSADNREFELTFLEMKTRSDSKGKEQFFHGVCVFSAKSIRYDNDSRFLGVYDTALPDRRHHADVAAPPVDGRKDKEKRLKRIIDKIGPGLVRVTEFRDGLFSKHSRDST